MALTREKLIALIASGDINVCADLGYIGDVATLDTLDDYDFCASGMFLWAGDTDAFFTAGYLYHFVIEYAVFPSTVENASIVQTFTQTCDVATAKKGFRSYYAVGGWSAIVAL